MLKFIFLSLIYIKSNLISIDIFTKNNMNYTFDLFKGILRENNISVNKTIFLL